MQNGVRPTLWLALDFILKRARRLSPPRESHPKHDPRQIEPSTAPTRGCCAVYPRVQLGSVGCPTLDGSISASRATRKPADVSCQPAPDRTPPPWLVDSGSACCSQTSPAAKLEMQSSSYCAGPTRNHRPRWQRALITNPAPDKRDVLGTAARDGGSAHLIRPHSHRLLSNLSDNSFTFASYFSKMLRKSSPYC